MQEIFSSDFWTKAANTLVDWAIHSVPSIVIIILLFLISMRLLNFLVSKLHGLILRRASKRPKQSGSRKKDQHPDGDLSLIHI